MRRPLFWLIATASACLALVAVPAASLAASAPTIGNSWVSGVTQTDATLEAEVNPQDPAVGVYYQFQVVANTSEFQPEIACPLRVDLKGTDGCGPGPEVAGALPIGFIGHGTETRTARVDLAASGMTLQPDTTYRYRLLAARKVVTEDTIQWEPPAVVGSEATFTTLATGPAPQIQSVSISHLTPTDATLEAQIDTEGLPTTYEFHMISSPCSKHGAGCELIVPIALPGGSLDGSFVDQTVSLDLNSAGVKLGEGEYHYSVSATSEGGSAYRDGQTFEAPPGMLDPSAPAPATQLSTPSLGVSSTNGTPTGSAAGTDGSTGSPTNTGPSGGSHSGRATADLMPPSHSHHRHRASKAKGHRHRHGRRHPRSSGLKTRTR